MITDSVLFRKLIMKLASLILLVTLIRGSIANTGCSIDIEKLNGFEPLYLTKSPETQKYSLLKIPIEGKLIFTRSETFSLACNSGKL